MGLKALLGSGSVSGASSDSEGDFGTGSESSDVVDSEEDEFSGEDHIRVYDVWVPPTASENAENETTQKFFAHDLETPAGNHALAGEPSIQKFSVGVEIDDVIIQTSSHFSAFQAVFGEKAGDFAKSEESQNLLSSKPSDECLQTLKKLSEKFTLFLITARPEKHRNCVTAYVKQYLPEIFAGIEFCGSEPSVPVPAPVPASGILSSEPSPTPASGSGISSVETSPAISRTKEFVCRERGCSMMIDNAMNFYARDISVITVSLVENVYDTSRKENPWKGVERLLDL